MPAPLSVAMFAADHSGVIVEDPFFCVGVTTSWFSA